MRVIVAAGAAAILTSGCVSAADRSADATSAGSDATAAAIRTCDLLNAQELGRILGTAFQAPIVDPSSSDTGTQCQWTSNDQTALVLTKVISQQADVVFRTTLRESQRSIGAVRKTDIPGTRAAFVLPSLGRTGMLVGDRYLETSVLVPSATPAQVERVATTAAKAARSGA